MRGGGREGDRAWAAAGRESKLLQLLLRWRGRWWRWCWQRQRRPWRWRRRRRRRRRQERRQREDQRRHPPAQGSEAQPVSLVLSHSAAVCVLTRLPRVSLTLLFTSLPRFAVCFVSVCVPLPFLSPEWPPHPCPLSSQPTIVACECVPSLRAIHQKCLVLRFGLSSWFSSHRPLFRPNLSLSLVP